MNNLKIWVRLTAAIWFVLVIVWAGMIHWQADVSRETSIRQHLASSQQAVIGVAEVLQSEHGSVVEVGHGLDAIASATDEQRRVSHEVFENIEAISGMADQNNAAITQTAKAAQSLNALAQNLQTIVQRFKT